MDSTTGPTHTRNTSGSAIASSGSGGDNSLPVPSSPPLSHAHSSDGQPITPGDETQYATYPALPVNGLYAGAEDEKERGWSSRTPNSNGSAAQVPLVKSEGEPVTFKPWIPIPLRPWFWIPLVLLMAGGGIAFEVALHFSKHNRGWGTKGNFTAEAGFLHYVYTFPPVAISMIFAAFWAWTDIEIRRLQPYVDLARGNAPPQRSLLLDYTRTHTFVVWTIAARNNHWLVTLGSLLVIITFCFQPLSAALFNVQDVFWTEPRSIVNNLAAVGLNQDSNFQDLSSFLTAAGYASANVRYGIGDPNFIHQEFTVAPFEMPNIANGTIIVNTTAVQSKPNCVPPDSGSLNMQQLGSGSWNNTAAFNGCTFAWSVNKTTVNLFGVNPVPSTSDCASLTSIPEQFRPVIFWFFTYEPTPMASLTMCSPSLQLFDVETTVDLASGNLTSVNTLGDLGSHTASPATFDGFTNPALTQFAANVTGDPLDGRAYNGMFFALTDPDSFTLQRQDAIQLSLPAAVFQAAQNSAQGLTQAFQQNMFANLSQGVYTTYLALVARTVYFLDFEQPIAIDTMTIHKRLFLSPVAVHLLSSAMFVLAVFGTILHIFHRRSSHILSLAHAPGTIASAVSLGGKTGVGDVLAGLGSHREEDIKHALRDKRFRIDPRSMRIVMDGEEGYEDATSPVYREGFGLGLPGLGGVGRVSRRLSARFWNSPPVSRAADVHPDA